MNKEPKQTYVVNILRRDQAHLSVLESDNFDQALEVYKQLKDKWKIAIKESVPFELERPIVTAFDPGLIYEINLKPVVETTDNTNNPYYQRMKREGLGNVLRPGGDVLDGGYKY